MITVVTQSGEPFSYHTSYDEAEKYVQDLRRVYPQGEWELEPKTVGRLKGHDSVIWAGECVVDALDLSIHQWMKVHTWREIPWTPPELHAEIFRYIPCTFDTTEENKAVPIIRQRFMGMRFKLIEGTTDRVVRYV